MACSGMFSDADATQAALHVLPIEQSLPRTRIARAPASRPRVQRRPTADGQALLHERGGAALHPRGAAAAARVAACVAAAAAVRVASQPAAAVCASGGCMAAKCGRRRCRHTAASQPASPGQHHFIMIHCVQMLPRAARFFTISGDVCQQRHSRPEQRVAKVATACERVRRVLCQGTAASWHAKGCEGRREKAGQIVVSRRARQHLEEHKSDVAHKKIW